MRFRRTAPLCFVSLLAAGLILPLQVLPLEAQQQQVVIDHAGSTVVFEPYAANILRVTLSMQHDPAVAPPGYGFVAKPDSKGWTHTTDEHGDTYRSSRMMVTLEASRPGKPSATQADIGPLPNCRKSPVRLSHSTARPARCRRWWVASISISTNSTT